MRGQSTGGTSGALLSARPRVHLCAFPQLLARTVQRLSCHYQPLGKECDEGKV